MNENDSKIILDMTKKLKDYIRSSEKYDASMIESMLWILEKLCALDKRLTIIESEHESKD